MVGDAPARPTLTVGELQRRAKQIRRNVVRMASGKGEGYVGQGLDVADILAVLFLSEMRYDPTDRGPETDRLIFSAGHYSIGLWAALAEAGHLDGYDLETYDDHCRAAGLALRQRFSTWAADPFDDGDDYAVSVHHFA